MQFYPSAPRRRLSLALLILGATASLLLVGCTASTSTVASSTATTVAPTATATKPPATPTTPPGYPVKVYFSQHPGSDSNVNFVNSVDRVAPSLQVATYAMQQLIAGPTAAEQAAGFYTPLTSSLSGASNCGGPDFTITLNMHAATPENGTATLRFCRQTSLAGDLTGAYIRAEINKTLTQFPTITKVVILNSSGSCFDDASGMNACLTS